MQESMLSLTYKVETDPKTDHGHPSIIRVGSGRSGELAP